MNILNFGNTYHYQMIALNLSGISAIMRLPDLIMDEFSIFLIECSLNLNIKVMIIKNHNIRLT